MSKGPLFEKSMDFAVRMVNLARYLRKKKESIMAKQVLRSGTAIGALIREANHAESRADFVHKLSIALKEAHETEYWIELLFRTGYFDVKMFRSINNDCSELVGMLVKSIKTTKGNPRK